MNGSTTVITLCMMWSSHIISTDSISFNAIPLRGYDNSYSARKQVPISWLRSPIITCTSVYSSVHVFLCIRVCTCTYWRVSIVYILKVFVYVFVIDNSLFVLLLVQLYMHVQVPTCTLDVVIFGEFFPNDVLDVIIV